MNCQYIVVKNTYPNNENISASFGIAVTDESEIILETISDITSDYERIFRLVSMCNQMQLAPIHLQDVVADFLADKG